ncbi:helix-turn-helix domain-containing protein [Mycobacterium malmoense]|uniref:helix-turn-helix domain-containing protein n=1 Tax=Mycobacterium malmoense TaxID=1780 RepID=UPI00210AB1CF|nr:helix-turn-helix transcriptional regulator [Mycobacterium malmoense]
MPTKTTDHRVAANVRAEMARRLHTQTSLAKEIGWTQQSLSRRLSGHVPFTVSELERIAAALDVNVSELIEASA